MQALVWVVDRLNRISGYFYDLYLEFYELPFPVSYAATWFYWLGRQFSELTWDFYDFSIWVYDIYTKTTQILSWETIWSYITSRVPNLENIGEWFNNWRVTVSSLFLSQWEEIQLTVLSWVAEAKQDLLSLLNSIVTTITTLQDEWSQFKPQLPSVTEIITWFGNWRASVQALFDTWFSAKLLDIQKLIDDAFILRDSFWGDWQEWRGKIAEFFDNPLDWLESKFTNWFLGEE